MSLSDIASKSSDPGIDLEMNKNTSRAFTAGMRVNSASATSVGSPSMQASNGGMLLSRINTLSVLPDTTPHSMAHSIGASPMSLPVVSPFDLNTAGVNSITSLAPFAPLAPPAPPEPTHIALPSHSRNQSYGVGILSGNGMKPKVQVRDKRAITSASVVSDMYVIAGMMTPSGNDDGNPMILPIMPTELNVNTGEDIDDGEDYDDMYDDPDMTDENLLSENEDGSGEDNEFDDEIYHKGGITRTGGADDIDTDDGGNTDDGGDIDDGRVQLFKQGHETAGN